MSDSDSDTPEEVQSTKPAVVFKTNIEEKERRRLLNDRNVEQKKAKLLAAKALVDAELKGLEELEEHTIREEKVARTHTKTFGNIQVKRIRKAAKQQRPVNSFFADRMSKVKRVKAASNFTKSTTLDFMFGSKA